MIAICHRAANAARSDSVRRPIGLRTPSDWIAYHILAEWETRAICEIMNTGISRGDIQGWQAHKTAKRYPKYGVQKGWERVTSPETGAENFSEMTDAEAQQLGFPF